MIALADAAVLLGIHPWCFHHLKARGGDSAGENGSVGGSAFDYP